MLTEDKAQAGENFSLNDNINTRDQRRALIWLIVLTIVALGFLVALGLQHVPGAADHKQNADGTTAGNVLPFEERHNNSVNHAIGAVELPGTIGKDQTLRAKTLTAGNTPWSAEETDKLGATAAEEHATAAGAVKKPEAGADAKKPDAAAGDAKKPEVAPAPAAH